MLDEVVKGPRGMGRFICAADKLEVSAYQINGFVGVADRSII